MEVPLLGFSISGFKSFYGPTQFIGPLKKINIVVGENNSGKSNVIRYLRRVLLNSKTLNQMDFQVASGDRPKQPAHNEESFIHLLQEKSQFVHALVAQARHNNQNNNSTALLNWFLEQVFQRYDENHLWVPTKLFESQLNDFVKKINLWQEDHESQRKVGKLWTTLVAKSGGSFSQHWLPETIAVISRASFKPASIEFIPSARKVETHLAGYEDEFGPPSAKAKATIVNLAKYANPEADGYSQSQDRWFRLTEFVRTLLRDQTISLEIPHTQDTILIKQHGRVLNLEDTGTGIHQAILLAAQVTTTNHPVVCIEEPESHFHPELQRQLMHFLASQKDKQFFITTHSAPIMDAVDAAIISVRIENGYSVIDMPMSRQQQHEICHRLGYRPSDLMQANAIIWIEGPSDRIYIKHWLKAFEPSFEEDWHFSFAIYGGRLLSRFTGEERDESDDLIRMLPINRFAFVIMDSDRKLETDTVNRTKMRIQEELGESVWVTQGREIENYISRELREKAVKEVHGADGLFGASTSETPLSHPLAYIKSGKEQKSDFDKPKIAEEICKSKAELDVMDLQVQIERLAKFIRKANRIN